MHLTDQNQRFSELNTNRWTLAFNDPKIEHQYKEEYFAKSIRGFRISFIIVVLLYAGFGPLDLITSKSFYKEFFLVRYAIVSPILLVTWLTSFHPNFRRYWQLLISICVASGGIGIVYMLSRNPANIYYYGGIFLIFIAGYFFIKLHFINAAISNLLIVPAYIIGGLIFNVHQKIPLEDFIVTNVFYIAANIISIVALYNNKLIERTEFKQRLLLSKQKEEIRLINENLEEKVKDRTKLLEKRNRILNDEINSRKEIERKLIQSKKHAEESDRLKSAFLANMSHEIRTPMNGIIGFLDLISDSELTKDEQEQYIAIVKKGGNRLLDTINDIIELSKIEVGALAKHSSEINIGKTLRYISKFFSLDVQAKNIEIKISTDIENTSILTDSSKLESILINLVKNAIKFTNKGFIEIGVKMQDNQLLFFVKDSGIGIPKDRQKAIFDRFVQADLSLSRGHEGSGLGLSICKAYVELLGGKIWVKSEPDIGTNFYFTINYVPVESKLSKRDKKHITTGISVQSKEGDIILIADDDDVSFALIKTILAKEKLSVLRTTNGQDAVNIVGERKDISIVIMDIKMPVMDGIKATEEIRKFDEKVPIIAQTAFALPGDKENFLKAGFNDYLSKPLKKYELITTINKYLKME